MTATGKTLCWVYGVIAIAALVATWSQNIQPAHVSYLADLKASPASRSFTVDIGFFLLAAAGLMVTEARRLGIRFVWLYLIFGFLVAISVTFPLFLIAREMRLAKIGPGPYPVKLTASDMIVLAVVAALTVSLAWYILS